MPSSSIFSQMDIVKIIESYGIRLTKGNDKYYGSIPPIGQTGKSLHVWDQTNTWYCHKNHIGGGIIDFIEFMGGVDGYNPGRAYLKACEISGLQPESLDDEEISKLEEKEEVCRTLSAAAGTYHANLTEENYSFIFNQWGITKETADKWNLGYALPTRNLKELSPVGLIKTGLVYTTDTGNMGSEYYQGRIIFPCIINGKFHYMSSRETAETPAYEKQSGAMKYKYLKIRSEKNTRISEFVNNHHFFGEDKITNEKTCFITEGLADCIVLNQHGFHSAALGSTNTSKENLAHLIDILKNKTLVFICFDNDDNQAGQKGALSVGQALFDAGIMVKVIDLPRGSEKKIDVAEFMKGKQAKDFEILKDKALRFIPYALSTRNQSESKVENLETAEEFVRERLLNVDELYRNGYISDDIKRFFGFVDRDLTLLLKVANSAVKNKQVEESNDAENNSCPKKDDVEILLITSLKAQNGKGLLACEKWVTEFKLTIAKMQPESLAKKLMDPKERKYTHSNFICAIKDKFLLLAYETEEIYREIRKINSTFHNEKRRLNKILIRLQNYPSHIREKADKLLLDGDPQEFIQATFKKLHIGDEMLADTLPVCAASTFLIGKNSGLPIKISGSSGKGKSSGVDAFLDLIPSYMLIKGGLSDKYLYYSDDMQAGSICFVDDKELSEPMKELVKNSITNFQKPEHHRTVINGEPKDLIAPERTVWIFVSVDGFDDEQINNRLLQAEIDSSRTQDSKVAAFQRESENADISSSFKDDVETCKCIFDLLGLRTYDIRIPFAEAIIWNHEYNRRNQPKFYDIIRAVCLYKIYQREQVNGYFLATIEDYETAYEIYKKTTVQNNINLTESEQKIISCFVEANKANDFYKNPKPENAVRLTYEQVEALTGINKPYVKKLINGKDTDSLGLGGKIKGLGFEGSGDGRQKKLIYYTGATDFEKYTKFSSLSTEPKIIETITKSINDLEQAKNEVDEIKKEAFRELANSIPSIPADTIAIPSQKVPGIRDEKSISIINNIIKKGIDTLKKEKAPESKISTCITEDKENKEVKNIEHIMCKNSSDTLISQNQGIDKKIESTDYEIPDTLPKVSIGIEGIASTLDTEIPKVSGTNGTKSLEVISSKIQEYLNKECRGNTIIKSIDVHVNDFRKLYPEFKHESRQHLEYAFSKVLKSASPLDKSRQKESTLQKPPAAEKKGIAILKKALQAEKVEATL